MLPVTRREEWNPGAAPQNSFALSLGQCLSPHPAQFALSPHHLPHDPCHSLPSSNTCTQSKPYKQSKPAGYLRFPTCNCKQNISQPCFQKLNSEKHWVSGTSLHDNTDLVPAKCRDLLPMRVILKIRPKTDNFSCSKKPWTSATVQRVFFNRLRIPPVRKAFHTNMFPYGICSSSCDCTLRCKLCMIR
jgi:hypothetical protein